MERKEKCIKKIPDSFSDPDHAQRWLEENAAQGYLLTRIRGRKAVFIKEKPVKTSYMLVPMDPDGVKGPADQGEEYKEFGWEYVTQLGRMVLVLQGMPGTCERVQLFAGETMFRKLKKRQRGRLWGAFSPFLFWLVWFLFSYYIQGYGFLLLFVKGAAWVIFLAMGLCGLLQLQSGEEARIAEQLLEGIRGRSGTGAESRRTVYKVLLTVFSVSLVLGIAGGIHYWGGRMKTVYTGRVSESAWEEDAPRTQAFLKKNPSWKELSPMLLPLSLLERESDMEYQTRDYKGEELESYSCVNRFLLAPVQAETMQYGVWEPQGGTRESSLKLEYYRLASPKMAAPLMRELGRYYMNWNKGWVPERVESGYFDELVIHDRGLHYLFARKGNQVIMAYYIGEENLADHLPELEQLAEKLAGG